MKIQKVIMSCDHKRYYLDFWELTSKIWRLKFNIEPVLVLFGNKNELKVSEEFGKVVEFNTNNNIPSHIQAQWVRYWFPITEPNTTWMISDIDMFPISRSYFLNCPSTVNDNAFANLNTDGNYFPACYNLGKGKTFKEVLELPDKWEDSIREVNLRSKSISYSHIPESIAIYEPGVPPMENWGIDESFSIEKIKKFRDRSRIVKIGRPGGFNQRRLDRIPWNIEDNKIKEEWYNDCHSLRPYNSGHRQEIDKVVKLIIGA